MLFNLLLFFIFFLLFIFFVEESFLVLKRTSISEQFLKEHTFFSSLNHILKI